MQKWSFPHRKHFIYELFKHAVWQWLSFKSTWFVSLKKVPGTKRPVRRLRKWKESQFCWIVLPKGLHFRISPIFSLCGTSFHTDAPAAFGCATITPPPPLDPALYSADLVKDTSQWSACRVVTLMTIDWHWTGHAGGCGGSALHVHAAVCHAPADVHIILCYVDVSAVDFFFIAVCRNA